MVTAMRAAVMSLVVAAAAATTAAPAAARVAAKPPTARQIAAAVTRAERSKSLWATINICDVKARGSYQLGIRGQMPTLGFSSRLAMVVHVNYWSATDQKFDPIPSATSTLAVGTFSTGLQQDGVVFPFQKHAGLLNATITFTWSVKGRKVGQTTRRTTAGHPGADYAKPPHYSAAQCRIK